MPSEEVLVPENPMPARAPRRRASRYATREERVARKHNSPLPYFRVEDRLCRQFLREAANPREFEGLKLLYPFERELSVLQVYQGIGSVSGRMYLAFLAGHDLGKAHPDLLEEVLPGRELREAAQRVDIIRTCSGEERLRDEGLQRACGRIADDNWGNVPEGQAEGAILEATLKCLRAGFAAATVCQVDPLLCDFVGNTPERAGAGMKDVTARLVVSAPLRAVGRPVVSLLEHPLLRMAKEFLPTLRGERETLLEFLRGRLRALKVASENECPAGELDLLDWISAGLDYGCRVKEEHPEVVQQILAEFPGQKAGRMTNWVRTLVAEAGGTEPVRLLGQLKRWQQEVYGWSEPEFYGQALCRVLYYADFAVWIPWATQ